MNLTGHAYAKPTCKLCKRPFIRLVKQKKYCDHPECISKRINNKVGSPELKENRLIKYKEKKFGPLNPYYCKACLKKIKRKNYMQKYCTKEDNPECYKFRSKRAMRKNYIASKTNNKKENLGKCDRHVPGKDGKCIVCRRIL